MVHSALHWQSDGADNIRLWSFAVSHAAWLYSRLPNKNLGWMTPLEIFTKTQSDHRYVLRVHVWGCPAFVLEPTLQDGQKYLNLIAVRAWVNFWDLVIIILAWLPEYEIWRPIL